MTTDEHLDHIHHAAHELKTARANYTHAITHANHNGLSTRTIAKAIGVSHQTIHNIIKANRTTT